MMKNALKTTAADLLCAIGAGLIVAVAYYFFQNSNGFAPGGVGGLATITYHLFDSRVSWALLMILFNVPIFALVSIFVQRKLGAILIVYMMTQSLAVEFFERIGLTPYSLAAAGEDFELVFACVATGIISGVGFSLMLKRFGASGGTYAISALLKKQRPELNIAYVSFVLDAAVVAVAFFVYGMRIAPVICTLINLFVANIMVDYVLAGLRNGYKFEIVTDEPDVLSAEIMETLGHGVTEMRVLGMYSHTERYMLMCVIRKKQVGNMMKIIRRHPGSFANCVKVTEVFGKFKQ